MITYEQKIKKFKELILLGINRYNYSSNEFRGIKEELDKLIYGKVVKYDTPYLSAMTGHYTMKYSNRFLENGRDYSIFEIWDYSIFDKQDRGY